MRWRGQSFLVYGSSALNLHDHICVVMCTEKGFPTSRDTSFCQLAWDLPMGVFLWGTLFWPALQGNPFRGSLFCETNPNTGFLKTPKQMPSWCLFRPTRKRVRVKQSLPAGSETERIDASNPRRKDVEKLVCSQAHVRTV